MKIVGCVSNVRGAGFIEKYRGFKSNGGMNLINEK